MGIFCLVIILFCYRVLNVFSSFAIILLRYIERDGCFTVSVHWLFLTVPWLGLQGVIVFLPHYFFISHHSNY